MPLFTGLLLFGVIAVLLLIVARLSMHCRVLQVRVREGRQERHNMIDFLNHFSRNLAAVGQIDHAIELVANYLADVLGAESLGIFVVDTDPTDGKRKLRGSASAGIFPTFRPTDDIVLAKQKYRLEHLRHEFFEFGEGIIGEAAEMDKSILIRDTSEHPRPAEIPLRVHTLMAVPMHVEGRFMGIVCAVNCREEGRTFQDEDLRMLENLSYHAALARNLVHIYAERSGQERILKELELGRQIQQSLLPPSVPTWGDYRFAAFTKPALEVGGDYYDFIKIDDDRLMVVLADATGKGVPACMLVAMCHSFVRSLVERYTCLEQFLIDLDRQLFRDTDPARFLTMAVLVINKKTHVCEYGNAGHTEVFLRLPDGRTRQINPEGPALGLLPPDLGLTFDTLSFCFQPGMEVMIYTDGLTETLNARQEEFGIERLHELWRGNSLAPEAMAEKILEEVQQFSRNVPQADDQTMAIVAL